MNPHADVVAQPTGSGRAPRREPEPYFLTWAEVLPNLEVLVSDATGDGSDAGPVHPPPIHAATEGALFVPEMDERAFPPLGRPGTGLRLARRAVQALLGLHHKR
jgi:hypothetical protein